MFTTSCFRGRLYRKHLVKKFRINVNMANFIVNKCPYPMPFFFSTPAVILKGSWKNSAKLKKILRIRIKKIASEFIYGKNTLSYLSKSDKSIGAVTQELLSSLLPREIGLVRVTGLFQEKFTNEKYPWLRQKEERNRPWNWRWNSWGFSIPKASRGEPIMQVSSFDTNMKPQKNIAFWTGFFRAVGRKNRRWHGSSRYVTEQWDAAEL